ncbi:MAG: hypothetical protein Q9187_007892, partial [Circinaria calcarea]
MVQLSDLTPVRVRGKNKRKTPREKKLLGITTKLPRGRPLKNTTSSSIPTLVHTQIRNTKTKARVVATSKSSRLSRLELLPLELLQDIFILCGNLNLPSASPRLSAALSSSHTKTRLVIEAFASQSSTLPDRKLQSALLRQRWLTYPFFKHCQKLYLTQTAIRESQRFACGAPEDVQAAIIKDIRETFARYLHVGHRFLGILCERRFGLPYDDFFDDQPQVNWTVADGRKLQVFLWGEGKSGVEIVIPHGDETKIEAESMYEFPGRLGGCDIPEKLLHGPWTQEKGDYLKMLLDSEAGIDWVNSTSGEIASVGLEDAIREQNLLAVTALVGPGHFDKYSDGDLHLDGSDVLPFEIDKDGNISETKPKDPQSFWEYGRGIAWTTTIESVEPIGVIPTTEHLRLAVLSTDHPTRDSEEIVCRLIRANEIDINPDDPEIVAWAIAEIAERNKSGQEPRQFMSGEWLLRCMDEVRDRRVD